MCTKYGPPEVLVLREVETPTPKDNEVLIRIHATAVTASDCLIRGMNAPYPARLLVQMAFGFRKPRRPILGMVGSGVVAQIGENVSSFKRGDEVFAYGAMSALKRRFGFYAEYICLPHDWNLAAKPTNTSFEEAAAVPYGGLLALHFVNKAKIQRGERVLIYGASGSIGTMAIQLAKHAEADVTGVCSSRNSELVRSLGATEVIDYTDDAAVSQLEEYDVVFDAVGKRKTSALKTQSKNALAPQGRYVSVDNGTPSTKKDDFLWLREMVEQGKLRPVIDRNYRLEEIVEAHRYVERGHKRGSVVISVA